MIIFMGGGGVGEGGVIHKQVDVKQQQQQQKMPHLQKKKGALLDYMKNMGRGKYPQAPSTHHFVNVSWEIKRQYNTLL